MYNDCNLWTDKTDKHLLLVFIKLALFAATGNQLKINKMPTHTHIKCENNNIIVITLFIRHGNRAKHVSTPCGLLYMAYLCSLYTLYPFTLHNLRNNVLMISVLWPLPNINQSQQKIKNFPQVQLNLHSPHLLPFLPHYLYLLMINICHNESL